MAMFYPHDSTPSGCTSISSTPPWRVSFWLSPAPPWRGGSMVADPTISDLSFDGISHSQPWSVFQTQFCEVLWLGKKNGLKSELPMVESCEKSPMKFHHFLDPWQIFPIPGPHRAVFCFHLRAMGWTERVTAGRADTEQKALLRENIIYRYLGCT